MEKNNNPGYQPDPRYTRVVDLDFDIGSETKDYEKLAETEKLKPMEIELRKLEDMVKDIVDNMMHLQDREEKMRNTNGKLCPPFSCVSFFVVVVCFDRQPVAYNKHRSMGLPFSRTVLRKTYE